MIAELSKNWWLFLVRGLFAIIFGVLALIWPTEAWSSIVVLFGSFALLNGILTLFVGIDFSRYFSHGWVVVLEGVIGIIIGLLTLIFLETATQVLYYVVAVWAILTGIFELVTAYRIRPFIMGEWVLIVTGLISIVFGVVMLVNQSAGLVALVWAIGIYAIIFGILQVIFSSRLHGLQKLIKSETDETNSK